MRSRSSCPTTSGSRASRRRPRRSPHRRPQPPASRSTARPILTTVSRACSRGSSVVPQLANVQLQHSADDDERDRPQGGRVLDQRDRESRRDGLMRTKPSAVTHRGRRRRAARVRRWPATSCSSLRRRARPRPEEADGRDPAADRPVPPPRCPGAATAADPCRRAVPADEGDARQRGHGRRHPRAQSRRA